MRQILINSVLFILFFISSAVAADDIGVNFIRSPDKVKPGSYETFVIRVSNYLKDTVNLSADIQLPEGWELVSGPRNYVIPGLQQSKAVYLVSIDKNCTAGEKSVIFNFRDEEKNFTNRAEVYSLVQERSDLKLELLNAPSIVQEGETFELSYIISNQGNIQERIELNSTDGEIITSKSFTLDVGESQTIRVERKANLERSGSSIVRMFTDLELLRFGQIEAIKRTNSVKVIPSATDKLDPYFRFPVTAGVHYMGRRRIGDYGDTYQLSLDGRGYLDRDNEHHLNFVFRGPNQFQLSGIGGFDQYYVEYENKNLSVTLGDNNYGLSRLLELGRLSRGGSLRAKAGSWGAGGYFFLPRFNPDIKQIAAGYIDKTFGKNWGLKFTGMTKEFTKRGIAQLASLQTQFNTRNINFLAELSGSRMQTEQDWAGQIQFSSFYRNLSISANGMYAGKDYHGFFTNSVIATTNVNYRINKFQLGGGFNYNYSNPALDTFLIAAPFNKTYFANINYNISRNSNFWLSGIFRSREDRFKPRRFHYEEDAIRLRYTGRGDWYRIQSNIEWGKTTNFLAPEGEQVSNTYSFDMFFTVRPSQFFSFGAFGSYFLTNRYNISQEQIFLYGGNFVLSLGNNISWNITYRNNYLLEEINRDRSILNSNLRIQFGPHELGAFVTYNLFRNTVDQRDFFFTANYNYTIGIPLAKRKDFATLGGKIIGRSGQKVEGIVLKIGGQTEVTDEEGNFYFENLKPGDHYIYFDPTSLGIYDMPAGETPIKITLGPGEQKNFDIPLVTTARLKGQIKMQLPEDVSPPNDLIIRLTKNGETKVTNVINGQFTFQRLQPGTWKYEVVKNGWQKKYEISPSSGNLELEEGEQMQIKLTLKEKELEIIFKN